jgi:hypothetical protein
VKVDVPLRERLDTGEERLIICIAFQHCDFGRGRLGSRSQPKYQGQRQQPILFVCVSLRASRRL